MTIVPVNSFYLKANFKETQIGLMRVGQPASITVDASSSMAAARDGRELLARNWRAVLADSDR